MPCHAMPCQTGPLRCAGAEPRRQAGGQAGAGVALGSSLAMAAGSTSASSSAGATASTRAAAMAEMQRLLDAADAARRASFQVMAAGHPSQALDRFLKARDYNVPRAHKMLMDSLAWRIKNGVDDILARPLEGETVEKIRASQLYGLAGYDRQGRPVLVVRVGLSWTDPAVKLEEYVLSHIQHNEYRDRVLLPSTSRLQGRPVTTCLKVLDMTGLRLSHLARMKMQRVLAGVDDLNYPEKAEVYYVVNSPSAFSACWKAVKPLLQERTQRKVQVLSGSGREELLKEMDEESLPHFVRYAPKQGLGSFKDLTVLQTHPELGDERKDCCSSRYSYHEEMRRFMEAERAKLSRGDSWEMEGCKGVVLDMSGEGDEEERHILKAIHCAFEGAEQSAEASREAALTTT